MQFSIRHTRWPVWLRHVGTRIMVDLEKKLIILPQKNLTERNDDAIWFLVKIVIYKNIQLNWVQFWKTDLTLKFCKNE